ncbi:DMT family transporter [Catellatospora sp. KI3]|uniref:DMT family transporter n=1 Tax=Catellatospora sp. KI3 TaxID=3041620 RepID=UPI002482A03B|nr:DMT family transporter [Catellatospora sp. KI3]MDI1462453.1 DMT family transporter [Catellatospora sp. KI3]
MSSAPPAPTCTAPHRSARRGVALCLLAAAGFGVSAVFAKHAYAAGLNVPTLLTARFALAAVLLWAVVAWRRPQLPTGRSLLVAIGLGAIGYACQSGLYFGALARIDASLTALLLYAYPALVTVIAVVLRRERADRRRLAALACSAGGLLLMLGAGGVKGSAAGAGVLLALGAAVAYSLYLTVSEGLPADLDLFAVTAIVCTGAAVSLGLTGLVTGSLHAPAEASAWVWVALLAACSTVVPIACVFVGVREVGASTAAILSCAEPAVTVAAMALVFGERLTPAQAVGGLAVLASVAVLQWPRRTARAAADAQPVDAGIVRGDRHAEETPTHAPLPAPGPARGDARRGLRRRADAGVPRRPEQPGQHSGPDGRRDAVGAGRAVGGRAAAGGTGHR